MSIHTIIVGFLAVINISCLDDQTPIRIPTGSVMIAVGTTSPNYDVSNLEIITFNEESAEGYTVTPNLMSGLNVDPILRGFGGELYILEGYGADNVIKYDARRMKIEYQKNLSAGSDLNLHDIVVISEYKAYISAYQSSDLLVIDPRSGERVSTVDLSRFNTYAGTDSAASHPYVSALAVYGDYLYAACQRLYPLVTGMGEIWEIADTSLIAIIDTRTDAIIGSIPLTKKNPASMAIINNRMIVTSSGSMSDIGGAYAGIETIDLASNTNLGAIAHGSALGGSPYISPSNIVVISSNKAYITVTNASWTSAVIQFDPSTGTIGGTIAGIGDASGGLAYDGKNLYVGDRDFADAGVAIVDISTNAVTKKIPTDLPPSSLAVIFAD